MVCFSRLPMKRPEYIRQLQLEQPISDTVAVGVMDYLPPTTMKSYVYELLPMLGRLSKIGMSVDVLYFSRRVESKRSRISSFDEAV